jgi:hypothetical protein
MSNDPKEKEAPAPAAEYEQEPAREPGNTVPFVPYDDSMNPAIYARAAFRGAGGLDTDSQVFPPLLNTNRGKTVQYVDFGFTSAREYWGEVVLPAYECFRADPSRGKAIIASFPAWHILDWIWHELHPGEDTRGKDYTSFQEKLINDCPELAWIRDVADAGKHRGLGRLTVEVREVRNSRPLTIKLTDGTEHEFSDVLSCVIEYWGTQHFS